MVLSLLNHSNALDEIVDFITEKVIFLATRRFVPMPPLPYSRSPADREAGECGG